MIGRGKMGRTVLAFSQVLQAERERFRAFRRALSPPVRKCSVMDGEKVPMVGRLGNPPLDILPFCFPINF
jgi:hypothetical protein